MGWDGNLYFCPTTSYHPITIIQLSDTSTIPYHLPPQLFPSHPTHHDKSSYHPNVIPSVSHLLHVRTNILVYQPNIFRQREHFYVFYTALLLDEQFYTYILWSNCWSNHQMLVV